MGFERLVRLASSRMIIITNGGQRTLVEIFLTLLFYFLAHFTLKKAQQNRFE